jgi:hypothetical protein
MASKDDIRLAAERDLETFIKLVAPHRVLGQVHRELISWWTKDTRKKNQLSLLPRDHQKSALVAYRCAWELAKRPDIRILYLSSTANLAEKQLKSIKDILSSETFQYYWPEHLNLEYVDPITGRLPKWTTSEIELTHPLRREEGIRDPSVFTGGLTTSLTGMHCDILVFDDIVVYENAYTKEGRDKVKSQYSLAQSIAGTDSEEWVVGTRYDPRDVYGDMIQMEVEIYNKAGEVTGHEPVYEIFEKQVEDRGDGTGQFLWPRQQRHDGKWFGFDQRILAEKRAKYLDRRQFRAQYYNDPNDSTDLAIDRNKFQYFERKFLTRNNGRWWIKDKALNIYASIDFAFSTAKKADHTAIVVIGIDSMKNIYVLDIERIKTDKISDYYKLILEKHIKWDFRKLRAECTAAQSSVVKELKSNYIQPNGLALSIDEYKPTRHMGAKEERMAAILEPRYDNMQIWHYQGGEIQTLEDELILHNPPHDDVKDALASAIEIAIPPTGMNQLSTRQNNILSFSSRFGGIAH